jgi:signal transduction histidine kinase/CheY-like chemotaxis protein
MSQNIEEQDYAAPAISELSRRNVAGNAATKRRAEQSTRAVARRLLSASIVVPGALWLLMIFGLRRQWYGLETCAHLFVCNVTVVLGAIVWFNVIKLSRLDEQRALAQEQLKLAKEAAESANRFKTMFFANISHEIRTPLTAINGFAELLLSPQRTAEQRLSDARVIRRNGEHLLTLINDILDLSKIEAGKMSVERILCCPAKTVGEVCSMLRARASEKGLSLEVTFDGPIPTRIQTDPTRLRQVLINLVANAIKFTSKGGVRVAVSVQPGFHIPEPLLQVSVTDTGIGITPEQQAALFQPFVQADASITRQYGGSGLGLVISQHFARALGGDITLESQGGRGSTFTVTVCTGSLVEAQVNPFPEQATDMPDNFNAPRVRIAGSVLVAEDGLDNQALIVTKLRETGLTVDIAPNGQVACEKALAAAAFDKPFDLILMDVQMPVMDGYSATLHLRGKGYRGPIIALTANAMDRDRNKCLNAGCNDFVTKPIQMKALFKAVGRYLKVTDLPPESSLITSGASSASRTAQAREFYQDLPATLAQMTQAIDREDRPRLKDLAQLLLGTATAAGVRELAPQLARLVVLAESEQPWSTVREALTDLTRDSQPKAGSKAA